MRNWCVITDGSGKYCAVMEEERLKLLEAVRRERGMVPPRVLSRENTLQEALMMRRKHHGDDQTGKGTKETL